MRIYPRRKFKAISGCANVPPSYFPLLLTKPLAFVELIHLEGLIVKELFAESFLNSRDSASLKFSLNSSSQSE